MTAIRVDDVEPAVGKGKGSRVGAHEGDLRIAFREFVQLVDSNGSQLGGVWIAPQEVVLAREVVEARYSDIENALCLARWKFRS
jgi:hypothetical protein